MYIEICDHGKHETKTEIAVIRTFLLLLLPLHRGLFTLGEQQSPDTLCGLLGPSPCRAG